MGRVLVVGSINEDSVFVCETLPVPGETRFAREVQIHCGGKGANQACAAAAWGSETYLVAAVGIDGAGRAAVADLSERSVSTTFVRSVEQAETGRAVVLVARDGENSIVVHAGANGLLATSDLEAAAATLALGPDDVLLSCGEVPAAVVAVAVDLARATGAIHVHNLAPVASSVDVMPTSVLVLNEVEVCQLTEEDSVDAAIEELQRLGQRAVVTLGARGAAVLDGGTRYDEPGVRAVVMDATGAGDVFCGVLAAELAHGVELAPAVRRAVGAGAYATTRLGARGAVPTPTDVLPVRDRVEGSS